MLYKIAKPVLFQMSPETAHHLTINGLARASKIPGSLALMRGMFGVASRKELAVRLWGIDFPNPVGLAAGLDKDAEAVSGFSALGFGFIEVGTVTPKPQPGNELPRLFRLPPDLALVNRMGFNNKGADRMAENLVRLSSRPIPVAVNIGKNKVTPNETAEEDYRECIRKLYPAADFFVVNISSPNTPDLRNLQHGDDLRRLLAAVTEELRNEQLKAGDGGRPVLVKLAPDLSDGELESMIRTILDSGVSGVIATNTTISREGLTHGNGSETGGLSGLPLTDRSTEVIRRIYSLTDGRLPIVGVGGIFTPEHAYEKIRAGASLVEIYTALIYKGPGVNRELNQGLLELMRKDGFTHISQAVGADHKAR